MDTLGAIVGPATALALLAAVNHNYPALFAVTLIPGLLAAAAITFLVRERERKPVPHISSASDVARPRVFTQANRDVSTARFFV
ncbi:MAG: hypothetical protein ACK45B_00005 [Limisphaerales bacterium]